MFGALAQQQNRAGLFQQLSRTRPRCTSCPSMVVNQYSVLQSLRNNSRPLLHKRVCQFNKAQQHAPTNQMMIRRTNATTLSQYNSQTAAATRTSHPILRLLHQSLQHTLLKPSVRIHYTDTVCIRLLVSFSLVFNVLSSISDSLVTSEGGGNSR